jgi:transitional endoplasmic reticulum ATPase
MDFTLGVAVGLLVATVILIAQRRTTLSPPAPPKPAPASTPTPKPAAAAAPKHDGLELVQPERLPTFESVGGMDELKQELRDTVGLVLTHAEEATEYGINWNGLLFHGPPGVGKTFFAKALAGEFKLNFIPVATSDLVTEYTGEGPGRVEAAFRFAREHLPCLLFFDEFDAVGEARADTVDAQSRDVLTQLLQSLEEHRSEPTLLVAAATNDLDSLDQAVIRAGRFDRHIRLDLPDSKGRLAIFTARLTGRPIEKDLGLDELARRTKGRTPAAIAQACDVAALAAFREAAGTGKKVRISKHHLLHALHHGAGEDRPMVEDWSWDRLVLPERTVAELQQIQSLIEDPEQSTALGVDPPTGVLLTGPPGTGKTTVAKVLAAEACCSFYPVSAADVTSRWVGESEQRIARLFRRARANAPSIVFIDEIDAIGAQRGQLGAYDRQIDQLLTEIDGMGSARGVLVIGATNRPQAIDPALTRGGRLSRTIDIPLPDPDARLAILTMLTKAMPLHGVDLEELALQTDGYSGADLKALCQQAAMEAMVRRSRSRSSAATAVTDADFDRALAAEAAEAAEPKAKRARPLRAPNTPK